MSSVFVTFFTNFFVKIYGLLQRTNKENGGDFLANEQNLIPLNKRSPSKAKEIQKKGGKASAEAKKHKKAMNEVAKLFLDMDLSDSKIEKIKKLYGNIDEEAISQRFPLVANLYGIAMDIENYSASERMAAMRFLLELAGESPQQLAIKNAEKARQNQIEDDPFSASLKSLFGGDGE